MTESRKCSRCGAELSADAPSGHCLQCLLQFGLATDETSPQATAETTGAPTIALNLVEKPGDRIRHYNLLQQIGEGGCGVVYMAEQDEPIRRRVAFKVIKLGMDTRNVIARFEAERQALAMMDHPNIAKVLDAGATPTGRPYFVMELVRGIKITKYCDEQKLSTRQRLDLFIQVCQAVQHAHQKGIIHRDLKPSNILVTEQDGAPMPKIIDFGIAKATTDQRLTDKTLFTAFEQFIGTPAYMSPEQAGLGGLDIDTRSDIYSLGVLLYELLAGKPPFDSETFARSGLDEMLRLIREQEPPRPSARVTTLAEHELITVAQRRQTESAKLPNLLRGDLDWIVMKALDKDRRRRYETANGLARDIERFLGNETVAARPPSNLYRFQKMVRRNKLAFAAGGSIAAALVIGLAIALWQSIEKTRAYKRAVIAEAKAQTEAQFLKDMLQDLGPSVISGRDPTMVHELLDRAANRIDRDLSRQSETAIEVRTVLAATYGELGLFDKMEGLARTNLVAARAIMGEESLAVANVLGQIGDAAGFGERWEEAERFLQEALRIRRRILGNEHLEVARALHRLGNVLRGSRKEAALREGLAICRKRPDEKTLVEADLLDALAVHVRDDRPEEAESSSRQSLEIKRQLLGEHLEVAKGQNGLGLVLTESGKFAEAETFLQAALTTEQKLLGRKHWLVGKTLSLLGSPLAEGGRLDEAEAALREAVAIQTKTLGSNHVEVAYTLHGLGDLLAKKGSITEAADCYRKALEMRKNKPGSYYPQNLLALLRKQGKFGEAKAILREALEAIRKEADSGNAFRQHNLAWILTTWPDSEFRDGRTGLYYAQKAVSATQRRNAMYLDTLAAAYAEVGEFAAAIGAEKEAVATNKNPTLSGGMVSRLKLYESGRPCREPE